MATTGVSTLCNDFIATEWERADGFASTHLNFSTFQRNILRPSSGWLGLSGRPSDEVKNIWQLYKKVQENWSIKATTGKKNHWPHIKLTQALKKAFGEFSSPHWLNPKSYPLFPFYRPDPAWHPQTVPHNQDLSSTVSVQYPLACSSVNAVMEAEPYCKTSKTFKKLNSAETQQTDIYLTPFQSVKSTLKNSLQKFTVWTVTMSPFLFPTNVSQTTRLEVYSLLLNCLNFACSLIQYIKWTHMQQGPQKHKLYLPAKWQNSLA